MSAVVLSQCSLFRGDRAYGKPITVEIKVPKTYACISVKYSPDKCYQLRDLWQNCGTQTK